MALGKVKIFCGKRLLRQTGQVSSQTYNQIEKELKAGCMRGSTAVRTAKHHVIVTWEVLQVFLHIATILVVSIHEPKVRRMIDKLVTQSLQPRASTAFCDST